MAEIRAHFLVSVDVWDRMLYMLFYLICSVSQVYDSLNISIMLSVVIKDLAHHSDHLLYISCIRGISSSIGMLVCWFDHCSVAWYDSLIAYSSIISFIVAVDMLRILSLMLYTAKFHTLFSRLNQLSLVLYMYLYHSCFVGLDLAASSSLDCILLRVGIYLSDQSSVLVSIVYYEIESRWSSHVKSVFGIL